jgi:hypothetical protein
MRDAVATIRLNPDSTRLIDPHAIITALRDAGAVHTDPSPTTFQDHRCVVVTFTFDPREGHSPEHRAAQIARQAMADLNLFRVSVHVELTPQ